MLKSGKSFKHAKKQQNLGFFRIFAEFSRKFALKVHEKPYEVGVRFFFYTIAKVFRRFQVARNSFSLEKGNVSPIEKVTRKFFLETPSPPLRSYMEKLHRRRFYHDGTPPPP